MKNYVTSKGFEIYFQEPPQSFIHGDSLVQPMQHGQPLRDDEFLDLRALGNCATIEIYNQIGSTCAAYALCSSIDYLRLKNPSEMIHIMSRSPRFIYHLYRDLISNHLDKGSDPRCLMGQIRSRGICSEALFSFPERCKNLIVIPSDVLAEEPSKEALNNASNCCVKKLNYIGLYKYTGNITGLTYNGMTSSMVSGLQSTPRLINLGILIDYLKTYHLPIVCTLTINPNEWIKLYNDDRKNITISDKPGLHCVLIVGFDMRTKSFIIQNSWGKEWGNGGFCTISFDTFSQTAGPEFWQITQIGPKNPTNSASLIEDFIRPFARDTNRNDEIDVLVEDELDMCVRICQAGEEYLKKSIAYIFNDHFQMGESVPGTLLDRMIVLKNFLFSTDQGKKLNKYAEVYSSLLEEGFDTFHIEELCRAGYKDWLKLAAVIERLEKIENETGVDMLGQIIGYGVTTGAHKGILMFGIRVIEQIYESYNKECDLGPQWVAQQIEKLRKRVSVV